MQGSRPLVRVVRLGLVSYQEGVRLQQVYVDRHRSGPAHSLLLCEHPPVYTTGIRHQPYPASRLDPLRLLGAEVHRANRGGLITFHGPGQLVCYPVLDLSGFRKVCRAVCTAACAGSVTRVLSPPPERAVVRGSAGEDRRLCVRQPRRHGNHVPTHWSLGRRQQDLRHGYVRAGAAALCRTPPDGPLLCRQGSTAAATSRPTVWL